MTTYTSNGDFNFDGLKWGSIRHGHVSGETAAGFTVTAHNGTIYTFTGNNLTFGAHGKPVSGTITGMSASDGSGVSYSFDGANVTASAFTAILTSGHPNSLAAAFSNGRDTFDLTDTDHVIASGFGGDDVFNLGDTLDATDRIDGGGGLDVVNLDGDYSAGLAIGAGTLRSIHELNLMGGSYNITVADGALNAGHHRVIDGSGLTVGQHLTFDGSGETDAHLRVLGGAASDVITTGGTADHINGGLGNDTLNSGGGDDIVHAADGDDTVQGGSGHDILKGEDGNDTLDGGDGGDVLVAGTGIDHVQGGNGDDVIFFGDDFFTGDTADGGAGNDTLHFHEVNVGTLTLSLPMIQNIETLAVDAATVLNLSLGQNTSIGVGNLLTVDASTLTNGDLFNFNGSNLTGGNLNLLGGAGNDSLTGGAGDDTIRGGQGADTLNGGGGQDTFVFDSATDSTPNALDTIVGFDALTDKLDFGNAVTNVSNNLIGGLASTLNDVTGLVSGLLGAHEAVLVKPLLGLLGGDTFMVIDQNGQAGYQAGQDLIVQLQNATHLNHLDLGDFLTG